jgi:excisionase family DNA binding protein
VAKRLGVSQATVQRAVARGTLLPAETTPGGHHRFRLEDGDQLPGIPFPAAPAGVRLISTGQAARLLGVSQHTVMRACREGRLVPDETTPGGHHRFSEARIRELAPHAGVLVGTSGAARAMGLTADKLRRAVHQGTVSPAALTPGGHRRFDTSQLSSEGSGTPQADGPVQGHG